MKKMLLVFIMIIPSVCFGVDQQEITLENKILRIKLIPLSAEQMLAFYEGRGFPVNARQAIAEVCFMTVIIYNKTNQRLWLDLDLWNFQADAQIRRLDRVYWAQQWKKIMLPQANRSTFGWTLLPEERDLYPDEGVGGNITLTRMQAEFTLNATFIAGENRKGGKYEIKVERLKCV